MAEITALLLNFLKAIGKYRWYAVVITWTVALIGWAVILRLPNQYEASARVYVDTQSILKPLLSGMTIEKSRQATAATALMTSPR